MGKIKFTKMVASGNDFVVIETSNQKPVTRNLKDLAKQICNRKYAVGADGLLVLEKSRKADVRMRIFNADGSEAEMCGNGARCTALWHSACLPTRQAWRRAHSVKIETKAGIIEAKVNKDNVKIKLTSPKGLELDIPIKIGSRTLRVNFINTGVPHTVIFVEGLEDIDVAGLGRYIRFHKSFAPAGTNVNFVEALSKDSIAIRTYERGVEDETLACGTGSVASALLYAIRSTLSASGKINVTTKSGEVLKVYFNRAGNIFRNVWLEGKAKIVYIGECHV